MGTDLSITAAHRKVFQPLMLESTELNPFLRQRSQESLWASAHFLFILGISHLSISCSYWCSSSLSTRGLSCAAWCLYLTKQWTAKPATQAFCKIKTLTGNMFPRSDRPRSWYMLGLVLSDSEPSFGQHRRCHYCCSPKNRCLKISMSWRMFRCSESLALHWNDLCDQQKHSHLSQTYFWLSFILNYLPLAQICHWWSGVGDLWGPKPCPCGHTAVLSQSLWWSAPVLYRNQAAAATSSLDIFMLFFILLPTSPFSLSSVSPFLVFMY